MTPLTIPLLVLLFVVLLVGVSVALTPPAPPGSGINRGTRFFLVLLRLAIGWHFLFEGVEKVNSPTWSSEGYLREASGPLAPLYRDMAGDAVADRLRLGPNNTFPEALANEWDNYFQAFRNYYDLNPEQLGKAEKKFEDAKAKTLQWLTAGKKDVKLTSPPNPPLPEGELSTPQRLQLYDEQVAKIESIEANVLPMYGLEGHAKLRTAKTDASRLRADLAKDLEQQTAAMRSALDEVLTPEQKANSLPLPVRRPVRDWSLLDWSDQLVKYGLLAVGICLIAGLLTRLACIGGALFLLSFFLAMPPLPWLPESPKAEGHYLYLNKNIIEMLALLALATTQSGRWVGLDGLLRFLNPWRRRTAPPRSQPVPVVLTSQEPPPPDRERVGGTAPSSPPPKEITHGS